MDNNKINPVRSKSPEVTAAPLVRTSNGVRAIIFDLGNVLIDFNHMLAAERICGFTAKSPQEIFDLFFDSGLTALFEEGKISPQEFFSRVKELLNLKLDYAGFLPIWNEIFFLTERNQEVYNLAFALKKHYKVALLSNINILHFDYLKKNFSHIFDAFHNIITSFELGCRKPHPLIYRKTLEALESSAENTFYTDDRQELVEAASRLGIRAFIFKDLGQLKKHLLDNGVIINSARLYC